MNLYTFEERWIEEHPHDRYLPPFLGGPIDELFMCYKRVPRVEQLIPNLILATLPPKKNGDVGDVEDETGVEEEAKISEEEGDEKEEKKDNEDSEASEHSEHSEDNEKEEDEEENEEKSEQEEHEEYGENGGNGEKQDDEENEEGVEDSPGYSPRLLTLPKLETYREYHTEHLMRVAGRFVRVSEVPNRLFHIIYYFFTQVGTLKTMRVITDTSFYVLYKEPRDTLRALTLNNRRIPFLGEIVVLKCDLMKKSEMKKLRTEHVYKLDITAPSERDSDENINAAINYGESATHNDNETPNENDNESASNNDNDSDDYNDNSNDNDSNDTDTNDTDSDEGARDDDDGDEADDDGDDDDNGGDDEDDNDNDNDDDNDDDDEDEDDGDDGETGFDYDCEYAENLTHFDLNRMLISNDPYFTPIDPQEQLNAQNLTMDRWYSQNYNNNYSYNYSPNRNYDYDYDYNYGYYRNNYNNNYNNNFQNNVRNNFRNFQNLHNNLNQNYNNYRPVGFPPYVRVYTIRLPTLHQLKYWARELWLVTKLKARILFRYVMTNFFVFF
ncbi:hypothetical protein AWZ03_014052 [Drosophila navojoa]|uniref:Uncharacterized protein n=1 Tax=Drosophila navojoa TaxID=7232 RepID=A0A484ASU8_DRONA|nr:hypothetical protein AWZ03_014052 [Drosophila navojoa]